MPPHSSTPTATDGTGNVNSMLYAAAWRATKAFGYTRLITYTRADEPGTSLQAAGWRVVATRKARPTGWRTPSRPRNPCREQPVARTPPYDKSDDRVGRREQLSSPLTRCLRHAPTFALPVVVRSRQRTMLWIGQGSEKEVDNGR